MASLPQLYSDSEVQRELLATIAFGPNKIPKGFFAGLLEINNSNEFEEPAGILLEPNVVVASSSRWPMQEMSSDDDFEPDRPCHSRPSKASEQLIEKYVDVFRGMMVHTRTPMKLFEKQLPGWRSSAMPTALIQRCIHLRVSAV